MALRNRSQKVPLSDSRFIGRKNFLEDFAAEWAKPPEQAPRFIVNLSGDGGIGKSKLLEQLLARHAATEMLCSLDANFDTLSDSFSLIRLLIEKTTLNGRDAKFKETEKLLAQYRKLAEETGRSGGEEALSGWRKGVTTAAKIGGEAAGFGEIGKLVGELGERAFSAWEAGEQFRKSAELRRLRVREIILSLVKELNEQCGQQRKFVLTIDTYEKMPAEIDEWLIKTFLLGCEDEIQFDLRLLISGRKPLKDCNRHWQEEFGDYILPMSLDPFTREEAAAFLAQRRPEIQNPQDIETIYRHTRGFPLWIALWAESGLDPEAFLSVKDLQSMEERLAEEIVREPQHREWLRRAALLRRFNNGEMLALAIPEDSEAAFDWLTHQFSLIEGRDKFWKLHDLPRNVFLVSFFARSPKTFCQLAGNILRHFETQLEKPFAEWRDLQYRLTLSPDRLKELLPEIAYYRVLAEGKVSETFLDMLLRVSDRSKEAAAAMLSAGVEALEELKMGIPPVLKTLQTLLPASRETEPLELEKLQRDLSCEKFSPYQKAIYLNRLADAFGSSGQKEKAIICLDDSIVLASQYAYAYFNWGWSLGKLGRHEEAIEKYQKAIEIDPQYAYAYNNWGNRLADLGRQEEAIEKYQKASEIDPQYAAAYNNWGNRLADLGRQEEAIEKYQKASETDPQYAYAYYNWGWSLAKLGRHEEAIEKYQKASEIDPQYAAAYFNWGWNLGELGRHEEAIEKYQKASEIDPQDAAAYFNWGWSLADLGRHEEAIEKYQKASEIDPQYVYAYNNWGSSLADLDRHEEAIEKYQKAIEIDPKYTGAYENWGDLLAKSGRPEEAIEKYQKALEIAPDDASTWGNIGWGYFVHLKDYPRSIEASQKALELDPRAVLIRANLAIALLHNGRYEQAKEEYRKTVQLIVSDEYSDREKDKHTRFQESLLVDLYDARKAASGKLLEQIEEIIAWLEKEKERL